jgi:gamma-glutamylcysteine synthetase
MDETQYSLNTYSQIKRQGHPECSCGLGVNKTDHYTLKCKANAWRSMFYNAKKHEGSIKQTADKQAISLKAQISSLQEELDNVKAQLSHIMKRGKRRGQQKGQPGHGHS